MPRLEKDPEGLEVMLVYAHTHKDGLVWLCQGEEHRKRPFPADFFFFFFWPDEELEGYL